MNNSQKMWTFVLIGLALIFLRNKESKAALAPTDPNDPQGVLPTTWENCYDIGGNRVAWKVGYSVGSPAQYAYTYTVGNATHSIFYMEAGASTMTTAEGDVFTPMTKAKAIQIVDKEGSGGGEQPPTPPPTNPIPDWGFGGGSTSFSRSGF
jgi:hypothetical protein